MQNFYGLYQDAFIIQTFGKHFSGIKGAQNIPGVYNPNAKPHGALALSIAAVSIIYFLHQEMSHYACRLSIH